MPNIIYVENTNKFSLWLLKTHHLEGCGTLYITVPHSAVSPVLETYHWRTKKEWLILIHGRVKVCKVVGVVWRGRVGV